MLKPGNITNETKPVPVNEEIADFLSPFSKQDRSILILGVGLTGSALGDLFTRYHIPFSLYDRDTEPLSEKISSWKPYLKEAWSQDSVLELESSLSRFTDIILSPGFPRKNPLVASAETYSRVWNDVDFFYPLLEKSNKTLIAITGTDGKSTTVELIRHILGSNALSCGNNDVPLAAVLEKIFSTNIEHVVIEFSSFMLEKLSLFRADYNAILNISPDHLDRYGGFSDYCEAKHNLLLHTRPEDTYLHNLDDPETSPRSPIPRVVSYSSRNHTNADYNLVGEKYYHRGEVIMSRFKSHTVLFPGNIFPALIIAKELGIDLDIIQDRLQSFPGLPHRLEFIPRPQNPNEEKIFIYNNSKATTLQAVISSIDYLFNHHQIPIHIILGGRSKNTDFCPLKAYLDKVKKAYFYGEAGKIIQEQSELEGSYHVKLKECAHEALADLKSDLEESSRGIQVGVLVLSPGCSSFDQFGNYRERGDFFKKIIMELF